jgi:hypothetical protein
MNRDHAPIVIADTNGLYDRSVIVDSVPADHLTTADNIIYTERGLRTRPGTKSAFIAVGNIRRFYSYKRLDEVQRLLILCDNESIYDSTDLGTPIITIPGMVDFSCAQFFNRIYITPHDRNKGLENESIYVYDGTVCRIAGGSAPAGSIICVNSALSGHVEQGTHLFAVSFETESGYITKPGPAIYGSVIADGSHAVDISSIPIGPVGTVARRLLATRRIAEYNLNQEGYEFFYIPTGRIPNNVDSTATVDFYDADLVLSADYLFDQLNTIPAGVGVGIYQDSLVVWGEYKEPSVVRISKQGDPEGFDAVAGYLTIAPNEAGGVKNCVQFRDSLYMLKSQRTYQTSRDLVNPDTAIFWRVINIDEGIGTDCFGVSMVLDTAGPNTDSFLVAGRSGLFNFNGVYLQPEFSWKIDRLWQQIPSERFNEIQVVNEVISNRIVVLLPTGNLLIADYRNGLAFSAVRWSHWTFPWPIDAIGIDVEQNQTVSLLLAGNGVIWRMDIENFADDINDQFYAINTVVEYAAQAISNYGALTHFHAIRMRAVGEGELRVTLKGIDGASPVVLRALSLSPGTGKYLNRLCNLRNEKCAVRLELENAGSWLNLLELTLFASEMWLERPSDTA